MPAPPKHVVFDVVGTLVSYSVFYSRIESILGPRLLTHSITAPHFGFTWQTAAELEFTFLSISDHYTAYKDVLRALFYRSLFVAGISDPHGFATDDERDACVTAYSQLQLREGAKECLDTLRSNGFSVWCFTSGDASRVKGYFERGGVDMPLENVVTCDTKGVAKPALAAYRSVLENFRPADQKWFAAAHMWDVAAAVRAGFTGAYCTVYERESAEEIYGARMEVKEDGLVAMARKIVEASKAMEQTIP